MCILCKPPAPTRNLLQPVATSRSNPPCQVQTRWDERLTRLRLLLVGCVGQGCADLYAERGGQHGQCVEAPGPLVIRVSKGRVHVRAPVGGRRREAVAEEDVRTVMQGNHHMVGYTGHVHGGQHFFAKSFGAMTRSLKGSTAQPDTTDDLLYFQDDRPHQKHLQ